jgi:hypothetical protein
MQGIRSAKWRKSSYSGNSGNCVEVATNLPDVVAVRDSKDRHGAVLTISPKEWTAFLAGIQAGEFGL